MDLLSNGVFLHESVRCFNQIPAINAYNI